MSQKQFFVLLDISIHSMLLFTPCTVTILCTIREAETMMGAYKDERKIIYHSP